MRSGDAMVASLRRATVSVVAALLGAGIAVAGSSGGRPFTVRDAIELARFVNPTISGEGFPSPEPIVSPDGKWFLLITERGLLAENRMESTIWAFDTEVFATWARRPSRPRPEPRELATLSASVDVPVIAGVRWLPDSRSIAFLGRDGSPYPRVFLADLETGQANPMTPDGEYVTAFDIVGASVAYTTIPVDGGRHPIETGLSSAVGKSMSDLLYREPLPLESLDPQVLGLRPATLRLRRNGREVLLSFELTGRPLRLFPPAASYSPPLSISPDEASLVTLAPVGTLDPLWTGYRPRRGMGFSSWTSGDPSTLADDNEFKPLQYVLVDLKNGRSVPLIDAPLARSLGYYTPSAIFWIDGGRSVILGNTFLPLEPALDAVEGKRRAETPAVVSVDVATRAYRSIAALELPGLHSDRFFDVDDIRWDPRREILTLVFTKHSDWGAPPPRAFVRRRGAWREVSEPARLPSKEGMAWKIVESCDRSPVLMNSGPVAAVAWDPNPQLAAIALGKVSVYHWPSADGRDWSGLLALPPDYDSSKRYPVVIQTHGYRADRFFVDGQFTTGSAGRALVAKGVVVLQMEMPTTHVYAPEDAPLELKGFEGAVARLAADGIADPKRIGAIGFSFTCYHVLYALTRHPDLFAAAAITDGIVMSLMQYVLSEPDRVRYRAFETTMGGTPWGQGLATWMERSPTLHLDAVRAPLLVHALERGALLSMWDSYAGLRRLGKPVDLLWLAAEDAPHVLIKPRHRYLSQQAAVDWFDFWLNAREDPDPQKTAQYARWRSLRSAR